MYSNIFLKPLRPSLYSFFLINPIFLSPHQSALAQENIRIIVAGVPADFPPQYSIDKLVTILAEDQLNGTVNLNRDNGTHFTIRFKLKEIGKRI